MAHRGWYAEKVDKNRKHSISQRKESEAIAIISAELYGDYRRSNPPKFVSINDRESWRIQEEYRIKGQAMPVMTILKLYNLA